MEAVVNLFENLTIVSLVQIIFVQQDYRTINFFSEDRHDELSNKMMQSASDSFKPFSHYTFGEKNIKRIKQGEPILNVVLVNGLNNNGTNISLLSENIFADEVTIVLPSQKENVENEKLTVEKWMKLSTKVLILTRKLSIFSTKLDGGHASEIKLAPFDPISTRSFIDNYLSPAYSLRQQRYVSIFFQFDPPRSSVAPIGQDLILFGPDGSLAETLTKSMKIKPIFSTDIAFTYANYEKWTDEPIIAPRIHYQFFYTKVLTKNIVKIFNKSITDSIDLHLTPYALKDNVERENAKLKTENLYPHEKDCLVIMVPKQSNLEHFLQKIIKSYDIQSICLALIMFTIVRIAIQRPPWQQWITILIKSLGIFLNQDRIQNKTSVEVAWDINLRGFSVLATIALSVIIYKNLISKEYVEIDTIDDLIASNLSIFAPDYLQNDETFWSNLKPILQNKINFKKVNDINFDVVTHRKFNYAYVFSDSAAEYMEMLLHTYISSAETYKQTIRIMHEKLSCRLSSYRISKTSPWKVYVNDFVRRFVENGLYDKHLEWIRQLTKDIFQVNKYKTTSTDPVVLSMDVVFGIFALYIVGVTISGVVFAFELKM